MRANLAAAVAGLFAGFPDPLPEPPLLSDEEKARLADFVVDNSGTLQSTREQVDRIYKELKALAQSR